MRKEFLKDLTANAFGLAGLLWIMLHLVLILIRGEVIIYESILWVLYIEIAITALVVVLAGERLFRHFMDYFNSDLEFARRVLELAIYNEKNGYVFYEGMIASSLRKDIRDTFKRLAAAELAHQYKLTGFIKQLDKKGAGRFKSDSGQRHAYLLNLRETGLFTEKRAQAVAEKAIISDTEALDIGIDIEKESILLYAELLGRMPKRAIKVVDQIINEEKQHLHQLTLMRSRLTASQAVYTPA